MMEQVLKGESGVDRTCIDNWLIFGDTEHLLKPVRMQEEGGEPAVLPFSYAKGIGLCADVSVLRFAEPGPDG